MTVSAGADAPSFTLPAGDGSSPSLRDYIAAGPVLLVFFKTTCPTCALAFPVFGDLARRYEDPARVVAVAQDPFITAGPWLDHAGFGGPVLDDSAGGYAVSNAYGIATVPTAVLVGADGVVQAVQEAWDRDGINSLARLLGEATGGDTAPVSTETDGRPAFKPG